MSSPELDQVKRRYAEVIAQLDSLDTADAGFSEADAQTREELLYEQGKIEHWLWALEGD